MPSNSKGMTPTDKELAQILPTLPLEERIEAVLRKYVGGAVSGAYDGETPGPTADARIAHYLMGKLRPWLKAPAVPPSDVADLIKAIVIAWLGPRYDDEDCFPGNPDYVDEREVDDLVQRIVTALNGGKE